MPPPVARRVRRAEVLALPLTWRLDVDFPAVPLQEAPQLFAGGKLPDVRAALLQAAWAVARDGPVAVADRAHFSPFTVMPVTSWSPPEFHSLAEARLLCGVSARQLANSKSGHDSHAANVKPSTFPQVNSYATIGLRG